MSNIEELLDNQGYWDSIEQCEIAEYIDKLHSKINELENRLEEIGRQNPIYWGHYDLDMVNTDKSADFNVPLYTHAPDSASRIAELETALKRIIGIRKSAKNARCDDVYHATINQVAQSAIDTTK